MPLTDQVQALVDAGDWPGLAGYYADVLHLPHAPALAAGQGELLAAGALLGSAYLIKRALRPPPRQYIPLELGPLSIDLQPKLTDTIHTVMGGVSGLGKSTAVLPLLDLPIGVLVLALDNTRPIAEYVRGLEDGIEWTNEEGSPGYGLGLDLLTGAPPAVAAEVLVAGWAARSANETGKWRDIAVGRLIPALERMDHMGVPRNFPDLILELLKRTNRPEADLAARDWAERFGNLAMRLGPALGPELDLVEAMRARQKVLLRLNRFMYPRLAPMLGGMLLVHARRVMQTAGVPFVLVIEEAGQLDQYEEHLSPIFQAGRDRGVPVVLLTQNMRRLKLEVTNNVGVWVSFAQEASLERSFAAERLDLEDADELRRAAFKDEGRGWCWVRAPGMSRARLVRVKQRSPAPARLPSPSVTHAGPPAGPTRRTVDVWTQAEELEALEGEYWTPLALPTKSPNEGISESMPVWCRDDADLERMWGSVLRTGEPAPLWSPDRGLWWDERGCLEWQGLKNKDGRGRSTYGKRADGRGKDCTVYRVFYRAAFGKLPQPTFDHWCDNPLCVDPYHGEPCEIDENNARRAPRKAAFLAARMVRAAA